MSIPMYPTAPCFNDRVPPDRAKVCEGARPINGVRIEISGTERVLVSGDTVLIARGSMVVVALGNVKVFASDDVFVYAFDDAAVDAQDNVFVIAQDRSGIVGHGGVRVYGFGSASVVAYDKCKVDLYHQSSCKSFDTTFINAHDQSRLTSGGHSLAFLYDQCHGFMHENARLYKQSNQATLLIAGQSEALSRRLRSSSIKNEEEKITTMVILQRLWRWLNGGICSPQELVLETNNYRKRLVKEQISNSLAQCRIEIGRAQDSGLCQDTIKASFPTSWAFTEAEKLQIKSVLMRKLRTAGWIVCVHTDGDCTQMTLKSPQAGL